ncbi:MAG: RecQ family zinc-binding domain-containing protein [Bdellovibrionales bacterium]|nr:RecQ family zinc-binding domain-containing protein [Bdellovibrionales bacterium]
MDDKVREQKLKRQNEKLLQMVRYVSSEDCRMQFIYKYFSEVDHKPCGLCDRCQEV